MRNWLRASVALFGLAVAAPGLAADTSQLQQFIARPENRQAVIQVLLTQWNPTIGVACPTIKPVDWTIALSGEVPFDAHAMPMKGSSWKEMVTVEGCGFHRIFNVASIVSADGSIKRIGLLPGNSHADILLEKDALFYAKLASTAFLPKDCKQAVITDTAFIGLEGQPAAAVLPGRQAYAWREEWTFKGCDVTEIVTIHFAPNASGTAITASPNETRRG